MSTWSVRARCPSGVMRSWYQVGRPSMLEGKTFLGATGIPILKMARVTTRFAVWLPDPLTVAAWMVRSLIICSVNSFLVGDLEVYATAGNEQGSGAGRGRGRRGPKPFQLQSSNCEGRHSQGACPG